MNKPDDTNQFVLKRKKIGELFVDAVESIQQFEEEALDEKDLMNIAELPPVIRFTNSILADAISLKASDIHIEPQKSAVLIRYRIDGIMQEIITTDPMC